MAYGKDLKFYEAQGPDHKVMRARPELNDDAHYWHEAFYSLNFSRPIAGMGGPLPLALVEIEAYCRIAGIAPQDRLAFLRVMRQIDLAYLDAFTKRKTISLPQPKE